MLRVLSLGHRFDSEGLRCACGVGFAAHQEAPSLCPIVTEQYTRHTQPGATPINAMRQALGLPVKFVADQCGVSAETARRALNGMTSGRHRTSESTSERIAAFVIDLSRSNSGR